MDLRKYLEKLDIEKKIDEDFGVSPLTSSTPSIPKEILDQREESKTPLTTLVNDLILESQEVQSLSENTINEIISYNNSDVGFNLYVDAVKSNHFNPANLIRSPELRPIKVTPVNEIKALERDVYRRMIDPRAPFIGDLYSILSEAGVSQYVLTNVWNKLVTPNDLYTSFDENNRLVRYSLYKERDLLRQQRYSIQRIATNKVQKVGNSLINAFSDRVISRIAIEIPQEQLQSINNIILILKQVKLILEIQIIFNTDGWERFSSNTQDIIGNIINFTALRSIKSQAYTFVGGINDTILDLFDSIEDVLPFDTRAEELKEVQEFKGQLDSILTKGLSMVEDDLTYKEGIQIRLEENRRLMILNSQKNQKTKQFTDLIDQIIDFLEAFKYELSNINQGIDNQIDRLRNSLLSRSTQWLSKKSTTPFVPPFNPNT